MMPIFRSALLLLALLSPAFAEDGPGVAAGAKQSAHAFELYIDGVAKAGERPNYVTAPGSTLFKGVFDLDRLAALPAPQSSDVAWLLDWGDAANRTYKQLLLFGVQTAPALDQVALTRNLVDYEDQCAAAMNFLIRFQAREAASVVLFMNQLTPDQRTPIREAGLKKARAGAEELIRGAIISTVQGMKIANARLLTAAIRDTRDVWAAYILPDDRTQITGLLKQIQKGAIDAELQNNLAVFADAFVVAR